MHIENTEDPMHLSSPDELDHGKFYRTARQLVLNEIMAAYGTDHVFKEPVEPYVFWFSKTLQNWKAQLSTALPDGRIYEVTYNGDKEEAYVDTYVKLSNAKVPDDSTKDVTRVIADLRFETAPKPGVQIHFNPAPPGPSVELQAAILRSASRRPRYGNVY